MKISPGNSRAICGLGRRTKGQIENHISSHDKQIDECVQNVRCDGNCEHVEGHKEKEHCNNKGVICYDCKQKFKDKTAMMDHRGIVTIRPRENVINFLTVRGALGAGIDT